MQGCRGHESAKEKAKANVGHSCFRAAERFNLPVDVVDSISQAITDHIGGATPSMRVACIRQDKNYKNYKNRVMYAVLHDERWVPVVWCHATMTPVTFPPEHSLSGYRLPSVTEPSDMPDSYDGCTELTKTLGKEMNTLAHQISRATGEQKEVLKAEWKQKSERLKEVRIYRDSTKWERSHLEDLDMKNHVVMVAKLMEVAKSMAKEVNPDEGSLITEVLRAGKSYLSDYGIQV